jgi:hypothetical protein
VRVVAAEADADDRDAGGAQPCLHLPGELSVDRCLECDAGRPPVGQTSRRAAGGDDRHGALDVDVVRSEDDHGVRPRLREAPLELGHRGLRHASQSVLLGRDRAGDGAAAVRGDGGEDKAAQGWGVSTAWVCVTRPTSRPWSS